ncbi:hypothetical protein GDO78_009142 [Eleutherodactylus coqui]|uniref:Uncharacterized protein n=1 Tax=Eleutherodactylus coqui TaxID=57060 RepID=A0A8J6FA36_ELECQ|nr:hypothetical protein GDO78_009142 [Eleutherodactylus coqui]
MTLHSLIVPCHIVLPSGTGTATSPILMGSMVITLTVRELTGSLGKVMNSLFHL